MNKKPTCVEAIENFFEDKEGTLSTKEIINGIYKKFPRKPWKENTIRSYLIGLSPNHPSSHHHPWLRKRAFMRRVDKGYYQREDKVTAAPFQRKNMETPPMPGEKECLRLLKKFEQNEKREVMYTVASEYIARYWPDPRKTAEAVAVLLLSWDGRYYGWKGFEIQKLIEFIKGQSNTLIEFRHRDILGLSEADEQKIRPLFMRLLDATQKKDANSRSPVSVAKALHMLSPSFFPIWDGDIAIRFKCRFNRANASDRYMLFCKKIKSFALRVKGYNLERGKTLLKRIDEILYMKWGGGKKLYGNS